MVTSQSHSRKETLAGFNSVARAPDGSQSDHFTFARLVFPPPEYPGQRADVRVAVAGSDVAACARTHSVDIVHRRLHLGADGGLRGPGVRFVRGAAEGEASEAAEPLETCGQNEETATLTYRTMANKLLITANQQF